MTQYGYIEGYGKGAYGIIYPDNRRKHSRERKKTDYVKIKVYAEHFPSPISNFKEFNKMLYNNTGIRARKAEVAHLLGYTMATKYRRVKETERKAKSAGVAGYIRKHPYHKLVRKSRRTHVKHANVRGHLVRV